MLKVFSEHTVETDLLNGGVCIDAGCLGFYFSKDMRDLGLKVYAFDLEDMTAPEGVTFIKSAITTRNGIYGINKSHDRQAYNVYSGIGGYDIEGLNLNMLYKILGDNIDVLKSDCEGYEYFLFSDENFKPIPKQISVEWHLHCQKELHEKYYQSCMNNLLKYYVPVKHELTEAHGAGFNYWDSLFVRRDLIV